MLEKLKNFFSVRKICTFLLILIGIILTYLIYIIPDSYISNSGDKTNEIIWIERLYFSVQIVMGIYIVTSAVVGVWQYYISTKSEVIKNESDKVCKAIDLAGYYKDNVIIPFSFVKYVYSKIGAMSIIDTIDKDNMINFDSAELSSNLKNEDISALQETVKTPEFIAAVREAVFICNLNTNKNANSEIFPSTSSSSKESDDLSLKIATTYMLDQMRDLLNNLEYFAMYFTHNIADDSVVFQSLHQSFFKIVETMYHHISTYNIEPNHKYYVNVIELYKKWKNKDKENQRKIESAKRDYNNSLQKHDIGTVPENFKSK